MSAVLNHNQQNNSALNFVKMNAAGNDFVIFDGRKSELNLTSQQIQKISNRTNIGCDQLIIIRNSSNADCLMEIYNSDGSKAGACGNATRCVAHLILEEKQFDKINIETVSGTLECWKNDDLISVNMGKIKFSPDEIPLNSPTSEINLFGLNFYCANIGNPHAVTFLEAKISDKEFLEIGQKVENHQLFPEKTNVEFAQILSDNLIEVRVFERGVGETLACGSGACSVAAIAIKNQLIKTSEVTVRFKGGDLFIKYDGNKVIMTGSYQTIFYGTIDEKFFS